MTFLSYLFVTSRNLLSGVFLPRKIITILRKITVNFRQASLKGVLLSGVLHSAFWNVSARSFKSTCEKGESLRILYWIRTSSQAILKFSSILEKVKEKIALDFGLHFSLDLINLFNMYYLSIKLINYFLYMCYLSALCFRRRQSETFLLFNCFYSRELDRISFLANIALM